MCAQIERHGTTPSAFEPAFDFPLDIWSYISDTLAADEDYDTLNACALTCKTFYDLCIRHIFTNVAICDYPPDSDDQLASVTRFKELLKSNFTVTKYVKKFSLFFKSTSLEFLEIGPILEGLLNVNDFLLSFDNPKISWATIPDTVKQPIQHFILSSRITVFRLQFVKLFPVSLIASLTHLKFLELMSGVSLSADDIGSNSDKRRITRPHSLKMGFNCWRGTKLLLRREDPPLHFRIPSKVTLCHIQTSKEERHLQRLLRRLSNLKSLEVQVLPRRIHKPIRHFQFAKHLHPSAMSTLSTLKLSFAIQTEAEDPYGGACEELRILASEKCPLKRIYFTVKLYRNDACSTDIGVWGKINDVVTQSNFPHLHDVFFEVVNYTQTTMDDDLFDRLCDVADDAFTLFDITRTFTIRTELMHEGEGPH